MTQDTKRERLLAAGWIEGTAQELLGLSEEEMEIATKRCYPTDNQREVLQEPHMSDVNSRITAQIHKMMEILKSAENVEPRAHAVAVTKLEECELWWLRAVELWRAPQRVVRTNPQDG